MAAKKKAATAKSRHKKSPARAAAPKPAAVKAHNPGAFLDLPPDAHGYETASVVVLSMPLEESVSYGGGTAAGPEAILTASQQVELYDPRHDDEPALDVGIHTLPPLPVFASGKKPAASAALDAIAAATRTHIEAGKMVLGLGGEHTVSLGVARGVADACGNFTVVHVDAHADLRDSYEDNPLSHACVMRRIAELPHCERVLQLGIRSTSRDQAAYAQAHRRGCGLRPVIRTWYADEMHRDDGWRRELKKLVSGRRVFFTFDVDGLDPSVVPATGTPEPDGLTYRQVLRIAKIVGKHAASIPAFDCVELAPAAGLHYADFTVARALYAMVTLFAGRRG
ncbi:MAG: agmatinase [Planctomycetaceae bacterium]|nr:agmatinase [Planctomycetaceae bacterium]